MEKLNFKCEKIDLEKVHKLNLLSDETEWILMVYSQFGFNSYEEIRAFALKYESEWMNYFYWSQEIETEFMKAVLSFYPKGRKQVQVSKYYRQASLNWFPTNIYEAFLKKHKGVEPNGRKD